MRRRIDRFSGVYRFLSNFWAGPVVVRGIVYQSAEHAYQASKASTVREARIVAFASTPGKAKRLGRRVTLRSDWEDVKLDVMHEVISAKFKDPDLRARLLATDNAELVEGNTWHDVFWGVNIRTGRGHNWLGRILMKVREEVG